MALQGRSARPSFVQQSLWQDRPLMSASSKGLVLMASFGRLRHLAGVSLLGLASLIASPSAAQAQLPAPGSLDVTPFFGIGFGSDQDGATSALGVGIGYNWTDQITFEGELGIVPDIEGDTSSADVGLLTVSANGLYHFDTGTAYVPYATFGLGFGRASFDFPDLDDSHTELAINVGGGVKKAINDKIGWRADLRYFNVNDDNPNFWRLYGGITFKFLTN
jgi:opacity protein-like surface antigen